MEYLERAPAVRLFKKWLSRFCLGDFKRNDQPRSKRTSDVDGDSMFAIVENKPKISTEKSAKSLKILTCFRHLKTLRFV